MLPARFHLLDETLACFLAAECGYEKSGAPVTVLSAFTRAGLDPWAEGARLRRLPRKKAARALAPVIAPFVGTYSSDRDAVCTAERLVPCLRRRPIPALAVILFRRRGGRSSRVSLWVAAVLFFVLVLGSLGLLPGL